MKQFVSILFAISLGFSQTSSKLEMIKNEPTIKININRIPVTWDLTNTNDLVYNPDVIFGVDSLICKSLEKSGYSFVDKNVCPKYNKKDGVAVVRSYKKDSSLIEFGYNETLRIIWFRKYLKKTN